MWKGAETGESQLCPCECRHFPPGWERGFVLHETPVEKEGSLKVGKGLIYWLLKSSLSVELSLGGT